MSAVSVWKTHHVFNLTGYRGTHKALYSTFDSADS